MTEAAAPESGHEIENDRPSPISAMILPERSNVNGSLGVGENTDRLRELVT